MHLAWCPDGRQAYQRLSSRRRWRRSPAAASLTGSASVVLLLSMQACWFALKRLSRWMVPGKAFGEGCITLAGDSFHPMTPNLVGQIGSICLCTCILSHADSCFDSSGPGWLHGARGLPLVWSSPVIFCMTYRRDVSGLAQDAVVLAQSLQAACSAHSCSFDELPVHAIRAALRSYERARSARVTPITVRSNVMGVLLGSALPPVRFWQLSSFPFL